MQKKRKKYRLNKEKFQQFITHVLEVVAVAFLSFDALMLAVMYCGGYFVR